MIWRWLEPGLGIKRWGVLIAVSAFFFGLGITGFLDRVFTFAFESLFFWYLPAILGGLGLLIGMFGLVYSVASGTHRSSDSLYRTLHRQNRLQSGPRIVAVGGGTGLSTMLRGLKKMTANLTAVVAVTDDGGSSGRIRRDFDLPAPGDLRNCLAALAPEEERLSEVVSYRFENGEHLEGHSLGNLLLTALTELNDGFAEAIRECSEVLNIQGRVLPSMLGSPQLQAVMPDGSVKRGETNIASPGPPPERLEVHPQPIQENPEAIGAVMESELIVVGPGSLYTSILTNFLAPKLCRAIVESPAPLVYICNLMTQPGETEGFSVGDHLELFREIPPLPVEFDHILVNTRQAPRSLRREYEEEGAQQVVFDYDRMKEFDCEVHAGNYMNTSDRIRHDVSRVCATLEDLWKRTPVHD